MPLCFLSHELEGRGSFGRRTDLSRGEDRADIPIAFLSPLSFQRGEEELSEQMWLGLGFEARRDHLAKQRVFVQGAMAETRVESRHGDEKYQMQWEITA